MDVERLIPRQIQRDRAVRTHGQPVGDPDLVQSLASAVDAPAGGQANPRPRPHMRRDRLAHPRRKRVVVPKNRSVDIEGHKQIRPRPGQAGLLDRLGQRLHGCSGPRFCRTLGQRFRS